MKNYCLISLLICTFGLCFSKQKDNLRSNITTSLFSELSGKQYLDIFISVDEHSLLYQSSDQKKIMNAKVLVTIDITKRPDSGNLVTYFPYDKQTLVLESKKDTTNNKNSLYGLQKIPLKQGLYKVIISLKDKSSNNRAVSFEQTFNIEHRKAHPTLSDILPIYRYFKTNEQSEFVKNGHFIIPFSSNFYPETYSNINFYIETYPNNKLLTGESYEISYSIHGSTMKQALVPFIGKDSISSNQIEKNIYSLSIKDLPSGNYKLIVKLSKENTVLDEKEFFFQRKNSDIPNNTEYKTLEEFLHSSSTEDLKLYLKMLIPISQKGDQKIIKWLTHTRNDVPKMQTFFLNFWTNRSDTPFESWKDYLNAVKEVDALFKTPIKRGFLTDRGKVYLRYGKPNTISVFNHEQNAYPYEIWHYYQAKNFSNAKFVFYSNNIGSKDYTLLHSNVPGELKNNQWRAAIHSRTNQIYDHDQTDIKEYEGDNSQDYFDNPR